MIYRTCFTDSQQGEAIAAYAWYWRKLLRLAILISDDEQASYSRNVARAAANAFTELGGEVVQMVEFQGDREEFAKKLRDLVAFNPQAILVPGRSPDNAGVLVKYIRRTRLPRAAARGRKAGTNANSSAIAAPTPATVRLSGSIRRSMISPSSSLSAICSGGPISCSRSTCEAQGYDALKMLAIGLGNVTSVQEFNRNMQHIRNVPGASALYTMKPHGGIDRTMFIKTIRPAAGPDEVPESRLSRSFNMKKIYQLKED